jgi:hypothetical protein
MGPLELVVFGFEYASLTDAVLEEVGRLTDRNIMRIVDLTFVRKEADGTVIGWEYEDIHEGELGPWIADAMRDLVTMDDIQQIGEELDPGQGAAIVIYEHVWALGLRAKIEAAGGVVLARERLDEALVEQVLEAAQAS